MGKLGLFVLGFPNNLLATVLVVKAESFVTQLGFIRFLLYELFVHNVVRTENDVGGSQSSRKRNNVHTRGHHCFRSIQRLYFRPLLPFFSSSHLVFGERIVVLFGHNQNPAQHGFR